MKVRGRSIVFRPSLHHVCLYVLLTDGLTAIYGLCLSEEGQGRRWDGVTQDHDEAQCHYDQRQGVGLIPSSFGGESGGAVFGQG